MKINFIKPATVFDGVDVEAEGAMINDEMHQVNLMQAIEYFQPPITGEEINVCIINLTNGGMGDQKAGFFVPGNVFDPSCIYVMYDVCAQQENPMRTMAITLFHEWLHLQQYKEGKLRMVAGDVEWCGETYSRTFIDECSKEPDRYYLELPWETEVMIQQFHYVATLREMTADECVGLDMLVAAQTRFEQEFAHWHEVRKAREIVHPPRTLLRNRVVRARGRIGDDVLDAIWDMIEDREFETASTMLEVAGA